MRAINVLLTLALTLAMTVLPAGADGPETGVVSGRITGVAGEPLPGVTITLEGPRGAQTAITDDQGGYRFALLGPGSYLIRAALEGFRSEEAPAAVTAGGKSEIDLTLVLETSETITVTSEAPMVDKFNVTAGATIGAELGAQAAGTTRSYYGVVNMLPGVTSDSENLDIQQMRPSVNGAHFADQGVYIDGVDTTFSRLGGSRVILPTTATTEITMEAGGASAEYGRVVGSSTNVIVKSGTNELHGDLLGVYSDFAWYGDYESHPELERNEIGPAPRDFLKRAPKEKEQTSESIEFALGGPIARDRAWYFVAYNDSTTADSDQSLNKDVIDISVEYSAKIAKLNYQPTSRHQLAGTWMDTPVARNYFNPHSGDEWTTTPHDLSGELGSASWNYSISGELFLETKLATQTSNEDKLLAAGTLDVAEGIRRKQQDPRFPGNPDLAEACSFLTPTAACHIPGNNYRVYSDVADDGAWHNGWILDNGFGTNEYPRKQANTALTYFASDDHELKFGLDWQQVEWLQDVHRTGYYWSDPNYVPGSQGGFNASSPTGFNNCGIFEGNLCNWIDYNPASLVAQGRGSGDSKNKNLTLYARDRFTVGDHWILNAGLRASQQENTNDIGRMVVDTSTLEPRLSATYDVKADGTMLASVNLGRYYAQLNQQFTNRWLMDEWTGWNAERWYFYCSPTDVALGWSHPNTTLGIFCQFFGAGYTFPNIVVEPGRQFDFVDQGLWDLDLNPYYKDEIILGFEWQVSRNWAFDAKAIYWELGDIIMNTTQRDQVGQTFSVSANADDMPEIWRALGQVPENLIDSFEEPFKEYSALQLQFNRRFDHGWAVYNNLTIAQLKTTGSGAWWDNSSSSYGEDLGVVLTAAMIDTCQGLQAGRTVPIDCWAALGPHLGEPVSTINRAGRDGLGGGIGTGDGEYGSGVDRPFIWKTFGYKQWKAGEHTFNLGGLLNIQDGVAWGRGEMIVIPTANDYLNSTWIPLEANGERRLDPFYDLNLTGAWGFPVKGKVRGELRVEVTNVTNEQEQVDTTLYGEPRRLRRSYQRPRAVRTVLSFSF